jgi:hypothetical protein
MTLGNAGTAKVWLILWCFDCQHQSETDPAEMPERYGTEKSVPDWHRKCGRGTSMLIGGPARLNARRSASLE